MKNPCNQGLLLFLLSLSTIPPLPAEGSIDRLKLVHLFKIALTWDAANDHCRSVDGGKGELASARNALDLASISTVCNNPRVCWVGLRLMPDGVWMWNNGQDNALLDTTWYTGHPAANNPWGAVHKRQLFSYAPQQYYFVCEQNLVLEEEKTWEAALHHCRALASDLHSFSRNTELSYAQDEMARTQTEEVWIGLRWLAGRWLWMDSAVRGKISLSGCPANGAHCGTLSGGGQQARSCMEKRRFFCLKWA